jgi:hypothetical protein
MRIVILIAGLAIVALAGIGIYYSPNVLNSGSNPAVPSLEDDHLKWTDGSSSFNYQVKTRAQKEAYAREHLGFVSLVGRLPKGSPITPTEPLDAGFRKRWETLDGNLARIQDQRAQLLKAYHEKTRRFFVESPGMGAGRMIDTSSPDEVLLCSWSAFGDADQFGEPAKFPDTPNEPMNRVEPNIEFYFHHDGGLSDFLYPTGFGYVKDREHVAGFMSHGFRFFRQTDQQAWQHFISTTSHQHSQWRVHHVQLIGILQHEQPVVYLTDKLPSMEQVRQGKTRRLDYFEETALFSLRHGEELYIVEALKKYRQHFRYLT